jgi:gamma-glutamyltranspeptidase
LTIKVTVQLEVLDITKLSPDVKSVENKASSEMKKKKVVHQTESKFGKYGKKKKKKPSAKLLREIDKKPAKRFKKVPVAEMMWEKIQKMEKTGVMMLYFQHF